MSYLEDAAAELGKARDDNERRYADLENHLPAQRPEILAGVNARRMEIADGFIRIAAIAAGADGPLAARARKLYAALDRWGTRDDTRAQPEVRRAANDAMDAIDAMVRELYAMRSRLVSEMRASDDATGRRVDALLAEGPVPEEEK
jgi:hypothetical protein